MIAQGQFNFDASADAEGYSRWLATRRVLAKDLARRLNLPVGYLVEVWLNGGVRLRGKLRLKEEVLFVEEGSERHLELMIDQVAFRVREMESCVRLE